MNKQINGGPKGGIKGLEKGEWRKAASEEKKRKVRARKREGEGED